MSTQQRRPAISRKGEHPIASLIAPPPAAAQAPEPPAPSVPEPTQAAAAEAATTQLNSRITVEHRRALEEAMLVLSAKRGRRMPLREVIEEAIDGLRIAHDLAPVRPTQPH